MKKYVGAGVFDPPESLYDEHGWVGNSFGPKAKLWRLKPWAREKNPGGAVTAAAKPTSPHPPVRREYGSHRGAMETPPTPTPTLARDMNAAREHFAPIIEAANQKPTLLDPYAGIRMKKG